jgi:hypothetical protein
MGEAMTAHISSEVQSLCPAPRSATGLFLTFCIVMTMNRTIYKNKDEITRCVASHWVLMVINVPMSLLVALAKYRLLLLLTHGLVSFKLLCGLCRYALSAFVPPLVIPNLLKNIWRGQAIKQTCE